MKVFALLTSMVLLVVAASVKDNFNLKTLYTEIGKKNLSSLNYYVEDLRPLTEGSKRCGYPLFCKVHDILLHKRFSKVEELVRNSQESVVNETKIVDHLKAYLNRRNVNCSLVLEGIGTSNVSTDATEFWKGVHFCVRFCNFHGC